MTSTYLTRRDAFVGNAALVRLYACSSEFRYPLMEAENFPYALVLSRPLLKPVIGLQCITLVCSVNKVVHYAIHVYREVGKKITSLASSLVD